MTDYHTFIDQSSNEMQRLLFQWQLVWAVPVVLLAMALWLLLPWYRRRQHEARMRESIQRFGKAALPDVSLDNGMEGLAIIDWLVLTPREILVITLQRGSGILFGAEKIDSWARVVGRHTFRFPNPLLANEERVLAVKYHVPHVPVRGIVLCEEGTSFPKGKPEGVLLPSEVTDAGQLQQADVPAPLQAAWDRLVELGTRGEQMYGRDLLVLRGETKRSRELIAVSLLMLALAVSMWSGWRLLSP